MISSLKPLVNRPAAIFHLSGRRPRFAVFHRILIAACSGALVSAVSAESAVAAAPSLPHVQESSSAATHKAVAIQPLALSATPEEISNFPGFQEPLQPVGDASGDPATGDLIALIKRLAARGGKVEPVDLEEFIQSHPNSVWTPAIRFNLGKTYHATGYFSRAIGTYEEARRSLAGSSAKDGAFYQSMVVAELAGMYARTGRQDELEQLLEEEKDCAFADAAKVRCDQAREGLATMRNQPGISFCCGPYAVANVARQLGIEVPEDFLMRNPSEKNGFSLEQVREMASTQLKLEMSSVKRLPGVEIPVPAVIHLKCGHFGALMEKAGEFYRLEDPTFGKEIWLTRDAIEDEGSGYFLVPEGKKTSGLSDISKAEASAVFGKGFVVVIDPKATKKCEKSSDPCPGPGMAGYRMHLLAASLSVSDTPLVVPTAFGPGLSLQVTYNQKESEASCTKNHTNFGPLWVCNLVSWLEDDPANNSAAVTVYLPGGGSEVHSTYNSGTASYALERESLTRVYRIGPGQYERRASDGSKLVYERAIGTSCTGRKVFLSKMIDPWGNELTFNYDGDPGYPARLLSVQAASGQSLYFNYQSATSYVVVSVADKSVLAQTVRKAAFVYDGSRLKSITDPLGIISAFSYDASGFMNTLTTPYGVSTFETGGSTTVGQPLRWLEATDVMGRKERVEFMTDMGDSYVVATPLPSGVYTGISYVRYRNSFYWSKKAWITAPNDRSKAHLYHWLHTPDNTGAWGVLEMEKSPFENHIWYNYPGQGSASIYAGTMASPSAVGRAIENHDGTTVSAIDRYEYHPLSGNMTKHTDPEGRVTHYDYDTAGYDLLSVRAFSTPVKIQELSNYLNHLPRTVKDAQGQTTTISYNARGQVETVTNALTETTVYEYEEGAGAAGYGMLKKIKAPLNGVAATLTTLTYDSSDRVRTATDSSGHTLTYGYDVFDRLTTTTYPDQTTERIVYNLLDVYATKDRQNRWTRNWYNKARQLEKTLDPLGRSTLYEWCYCGALQKLTDAKQQVTSWKYDAQGRNYEKTYPDNRTESATFQPLSGRINTTTDAAGQITTFTYNKDGSLKTKAYSGLASGTAATNGVSYTYAGDFARLTEITSGADTTSIVYYPVVEPGGQLGAMRVKTVDGPLSGTSDIITYTYDALGRLKTSNIGPVGTENLVTRNYDSLGRIGSIAVKELGTSSNPSGTFGYAYVGDGASPAAPTSRPDHITFPNGQRTNFGYHDNKGDFRLQAITHLNAATSPATLSRFEYSYLPAGNIDTWQRQAGNDPAAASLMKLGYDAADQLTSAIVAPVSTPAVASKVHSYQYDLAGNPTSRQSGNQVDSATFNSANRITALGGGGKLLVSGTTSEPAKVKVNGQTAVTGPPPTNLYEAWLQVSPGQLYITVEATDYATPPNTTNPSPSWRVEVTGSLARSFTYDGNGNTKSDGVRTCEWDAENRLVKITQGVNVYEFIYDGMSRRVAEKKNGTVTKRWVWDGTRIAEQRAADGTTVERRYYDQGERRVTGSDAGAYYYTRDHLGSIREMTDSSAALRARYDYDPYGVRIKSSGDLDCDFGFTGHFYHAETGLHLTLFRAYDQNLGRWLSADPIGEEGGLNLYAYVRNNPTNLVDPLGLAWQPGGLGGGLLKNNTKQNICYLSDSKYHRLAPGESTRFWTDDVDGYWVDGKFYMIATGTVDSTMLLDGIGVHRAGLPQRLPWDGKNEKGSPRSRGAPTNDQPKCN